MGVDENKAETELKIWSLCRRPFWLSRSGGTSSTTISSGSASRNVYQQTQSQQLGETSSVNSVNTVSLVAKSLLPTRRRLKLDPPQKLYFPYEPGKQARSAIGIKNTSKSHVAFKFQTTAPKSCYMRPPGGILAPGESIVATVFKFVEPPESDEKPVEQKSKVKFKIMSLKVKGEMEYVPELFDEQKDQVAVEQILRVVFLDPERPSPALEKLKHQLAEAEAALGSKKKPPEDTGPRIVGEGLVIDEWKERRERYLARQQVEGLIVDSV
ncbi:vesicle-associated protein 4-1-like [Tripterygium wilfordii]|uniref:Vesicle-associated protein 4-1-like n=1 Tax=Tripterygium wilfordii TaxID=458696 RepID=A0A7J7D541_TRIWF|nr:vesicle-associated protein 4-1-like [Tripterygium wilfordii]KAF5741477.1 vesicle-associated protein 4-1-like [Tripterygium wilfordii]